MTLPNPLDSTVKFYLKRYGRHAVKGAELGGYRADQRNGVVEALRVAVAKLPPRDDR